MTTLLVMFFCLVIPLSMTLQIHILDTLVNYIISAERFDYSFFYLLRIEAVFYKNGVLRNFAKFTGKHLCQSFFSNKVAGQACNFIKKETFAQVFSRELCKSFKNTFSCRTPPVAASLRRTIKSFYQLT